MAKAQQLVPESLFDLLLRAWPVLLVLAGLSILLRSRLRFGSGLALLLSVVLAGGIAALGYSTRASQQRDDYHETVNQAVADPITLLHIDVQTVTANLEVLPRLTDERLITGEFVGSLESRLDSSYERKRRGCQSHPG